MPFVTGYNGTIEERMDKSTDKSGGPDSCWLWTKTKDTCGYGLTSIGKKHMGAHRMAYMLAYGDIPHGMLIMHSCDNPACVNPKHLSLGTKKLNSDDKINKNRGVWLKCEKHPMAKLNPAQVQEIKEHAIQGKTFTEIGRIYGVYRTTIARIVNGISWT